MCYCNDHIIDRLTTISFVIKYPFLKVEASFDNSTDAIAFSQNNKIDIFFLDIETNINGLELREKLDFFIIKYLDQTINFEITIDSKNRSDTSSILIKQSKTLL